MFWNVRGALSVSIASPLSIRRSPRSLMLSRVAPSYLKRMDDGSAPGLTRNSYFKRSGCTAADISMPLHAFR